MKPFYITAKYCLAITVFFCQTALSQSIATFNSVTPGTQAQSLIIPSTHTFQRIIKSGDLLNDATTLGSNLDFTGYVPISGSSRNGYLSISSESTPARVGIMTVTYNYATHTWDKSNSGNVFFQAGGAGTPFGTTPVTRFCSGTVTPNGTIMVAEENMTQGDTNGDGYNDDGWIIEIDPVTKSVIESDPTHTGLDKLWAIGRQSRENILIAPDNRTLYTGADNGTSSYVYKFVATTAGNFSSGLLYVLVTTGSFGTGTWKLIPNSTIAQRNTILAASANTAAPGAAYSFNGVEDIERGPDGKIYFTAKGPGRIYRFTDNGATVSNLEIFVENTTYDVDPGPAVANEPWGIGNDNLAFDGEGNLWVLQDGDRNHIWVVGPTHTASTPAVRLFGKTPAGSEPTGITFTPDYKFMFISFQHPNVGNTASQLDGAGISVVFNTHTTVVIARTENLGSTATLPVNMNDFNVYTDNNSAQLSWYATNVINHSHFEIERSTDGRNFEKIYTDMQALSNGSSTTVTYSDKHLPASNIIYYRIKQVDVSGGFQYSETKSIKLLGIKKSEISIYPNPANEILHVEYTSVETKQISITIVDALGRNVFAERRKLVAGKNILTLDINKFNKGNYTLTINNENGIEIQRLQFSKM